MRLIKDARGVMFALVVLSLTTESASAADKSAGTQVNSPLSPAESLKHLKLAPGLRIELVAVEPQVIDPVAIAFDEDGRMWVVEMTDYPNGPGPGEPPKSRVRVLEDRDGDGRFETARTFVDQLLFATGLQLWKGGVFVTLAGKVMYFRDSNGDGKADVQKIWFTGFAQENEQLRANHPTLGLDNRIYIANGLRDGTIVGRPTSDGKPAQPVSISGRDFRFDPRTENYDTVTGRGQFGLTFDDFGNRFVCTNRNATKHIVLKRRYIDRNPLQSVPAATYDVCPPGTGAVVFPLSRNWTHYSDHLGQITAACGVLVNRGDALPAEFAGNVFICEPPGNLIHRRTLTPEGSTFGSRRVREGVEFLASPDDWFRPVNLTIGPDGALYVVDMYRAVVEHPHWLPEDLSRKLPLNAGNDRGRIYRIVSAKESRGKVGRIANPSERNSIPSYRLSKASGQRLVQLLEHPNSWQRETAARLLYERQDKGVRLQLQDLARKGQTAVARVHALWALKGIGQLTQEVISGAMDDSHPRVREQAVLLSERWLETSTLRCKVIAMAADPDDRLRFQVALSLGQAKANREITDALKRIALHKDADAWTRSAVLSSVRDQSSQMLLGLLAGVRTMAFQGRRDKKKPTALEGHRAKDNRRVSEPVMSLAADLSHLVGAGRKTAEIQAAIKASVVSNKQGLSVPREIQLVVLTELGRGVVWRNGSFAKVLNGIAKQNGPLSLSLNRLLSEAATTAQNSKEPTATRRQCIELLRFVGFQRAGDALMQLVQSKGSQELRLQAIDALSSYDNAEIGDVLLADFRANTPPVRSAVLDAMLSDDQRTRLLLSAFAEKRLAIAELSPRTVRRLVNHQDAKIRQHAKDVLADAIPANRQKVLKDYQPALSLKSDAKRGRLLFQKNCTECHRVSGLGVNVGPYIGDFLLKPNVRTNPAVILESILNPNRAIDANYVSYSIVTNSGKVHTGVIAQETAASVTLKQPKNKTVTVLRDDIEELRSNGISLMPEGFEKNITVEQMADLIAFLRDWRFLDGLVPLDRRN